MILSALSHIDAPLMWIGKAAAKATGGVLGPLGAFALDGRVDTFLRHKSAAGVVVETLGTLLPGKTKHRVLDVGGSGELAQFLPEDFEVVTANPGSYHGDRVDGTALPYLSKHFDAVVSLDTLEHIPRPKRLQFLAELKRVTRRDGLTLIQWPSHDGKDYRAREADETFQRWHRRFARRPEPNILEHEIHGHPVPTPMASSYQSGWFNLTHWYWIMAGERVPFVRIAIALYYSLWPHKAHSKPPWYACRVVIP